MQIYYLLLERQFVIQVNIKYNKIDISNWGEEEEEICICLEEDCVGKYEY